MLESRLLSPELQSDIGMLARHSLLPVPSHQSNFGTQVHLSPENQDNVEMEGPPSPGPQGLSSTSTAPCEFHIASSYMNLTVVNVGYRWGESLPPPINSGKEGQPGMVGEDKHTYELVCGTIHILVLPLIKCLF